jgi:hypothetical protein
MAMSKEATFVLGALMGAVIVKAVAKKGAAAAQAAAPVEPPQLPADLQREEEASRGTPVRKVPVKAVRA